MVTPRLREWLAEGPFALGLSSGFFGFFAHTGVLRVLEGEGLAPVRLSGSRARAKVAGSWAAGVDAVRLGDELERLERADFWDPAPGLGLLRGRRFRERLERLLPVRGFAACRAPLTVSAFDVYARRTRVLDAGDLPSAICASCAVPGLFHPVWRDGRPLLDGGIADRPGLAGLLEGRTLHHHLASRSPWRRRNSASMAVPRRAGLVALVIEGLPRAGPFRLDAGTRAFARAVQATQIALSLPVGQGVVRVAAD
jgi:NTE family protein